LLARNEEKRQWNRRSKDVERNPEPSLLFRIENDFD
jgi:hypothetical protein